MTPYVYAIDPGNTDSAGVLVETDTYAPHYPEKIPNDDMRAVLESVINAYSDAGLTVVIERIASYGMAVGREVFETCEWVGRFAETAERMGVKVEYVYRRDEKLTICGSPKANDSNIRRALIDRFAKHDFKNGKGTKAKPDTFYGFKADCWSAFACAVVVADRWKEEQP